MGDVEHHYIRVNGIRMHYVRAGSGPLLVLLHGFPEFWYSWRYQIPALCSHFTVVAPDLRGYNETDKPPFVWDYRVDVLLKDVRELIRVLGYEQAVIVGHDWGGQLAWYMGIHYPEYVDRLVVMNVPHPVLFADALHFNPSQMIKSAYVSFFQLPVVPELLIVANDYELLERTLRESAARDDTFSDEDILAYKQALSKRGALTAALNWYRAYVSMGGNLKTFFGSRKHVDAPTLLVWGEQDTFLGQEITRDTGKYVPDLHICYLPQCSHWVQQECPDAVNRCILEFLSKTG